MQNLSVVVGLNGTSKDGYHMFSYLFLKSIALFLIQGSLHRSYQS